MENQELRELVRKLPNQIAVNEIMIFLKGKKEQDIMELAAYIIDEFEGPERVAFIKILSKKLNKHSNLLAILDIGYKKYLVSEIGYWLRFIQPKVSLKKLIFSLSKQNETKVIDMILYKLSFIGNHELQKEINKQLKEVGLKPFENI